ncbi:MAG: hypothetical protein U0271_09360 [Polyangiaceae bacterium]
MRLPLSNALWLAVVFGIVGMGCGDDGSGGAGGGTGATGGAGGDGGAGATAVGAGGSGGSSSSFMTDGGGGTGGAAAPSVLYVHDNTTLFQGDPSVSPLTLTQIGDFDCIGGTGESTAMTDVAVNDAGEVWAISATRIYRITIEGSTVHCAETIPLNNPQGIRFYGLTFAPRGVLSPTDEVLIAGNSAGELWSVDKDGNLAQRGTLGIVPANDGHGHSYDAANVGKTWELSGDIAFFENNGSPVGFATLRDCPTPPDTTGCSNIDTLVDLDVPALATSTTQSVLKSVRGQIVRRPSCSDTATGYGSVYGIAAWLGKVYGFSRKSGNGYAIEIDNVDGGACLIDTYAGHTWAGAGVTTVAPIIDPPH